MGENAPSGREKIGEHDGEISFCLFGTKVFRGSALGISVFEFSDFEVFTFSFLDFWVVRFVLSFQFLSLQFFDFLGFQFLSCPFLKFSAFHFWIFALSKFLCLKLLRF